MGPGYRTGNASGAALLPLLAAERADCAHAGDPARCSRCFIESCLAALRSHLDMDVAFIGRFEGSRRVFDFVDAGSADCVVRQGQSDPSENSYCERVVAGTIPQLIRDAGVEPGVADLAATRDLPVGAHISVPLRRSSGNAFGTLCCFSHRPDPSLRRRDHQLVSMVAEIVSPQLEVLLDDDREHAERATHIRKVLDAGGPAMALQPVIDLDTGHTYGFEALARFTTGPGWTPDRWFAEADTVGLGAELEGAAIAAALALLPELPPEAKLSVNVSAAALKHPDVLALVSGPEAGRLIVELTEHARVDDYDLLSDELARLRAAGARIAVDDAGSGWAGLEHILEFRPEVLKLDRSLIAGIDRHPGRQAMVAAFVGFAARVDAVLVAEGIETPAERDTVRSLGVRLGQGYLLGRPEIRTGRPPARSSAR